MNVSKKVTDFIVLDEGNIGRKAAVVTGAALASSVLGAVLMTQTAEAVCHDDVNMHFDSCDWHYHNQTWTCDHNHGHENHDQSTPC
jgi:hypothetical protein